MAEKKKRFIIFPEQYGYFPYVFLIYLFLPAYYIVSENGWKLLLGWGLLLLFLISYRQLYVSFGKKSFTFWLILQLIIILQFSLFYNINNLFLGFFTSYFLGWYKSKRLFFFVYSLFALILSLPVIINYESLIRAGSYYYVVYLLIMFIVPFGIKSMNSRMELEKKLDDANKRIEDLVKKEERMRIARDLHDTLGHTLSLITLKSQLVSKLAKKDPDRSKLDAKEIERTSRMALAQVRELVSDMKSISITEVLVETESMLKTAGISFHVKGDVETKNISSVSQNILSMCLREAVTNVVKHSKAENCYVLLEQTAGKMKIVIKDDGIGFSESGGSGNGLEGMSERLELVDGILEIFTEEGTKLEFTVPMIAKDRDRKVGASS